MWTATDGYIVGIVVGITSFTLYSIFVMYGMPLRGLLVATILNLLFYWQAYKAEKGGR